MSLKRLFSKIFAQKIVNQTKKWSENPVQTQQKVFRELIKIAKTTSIGKDHNFKKISSFDDFAKQVPIRDYEQIKSYIERVVKGEKDVLWKGKPLYFAKTSGTTSGAKYIPLTKESMPAHIIAT